MHLMHLKGRGGGVGGGGMSWNEGKKEPVLLIPQAHRRCLAGTLLQVLKLVTSQLPLAMDYTRLFLVELLRKTQRGGKISDG